MKRLIISICVLFLLSACTTPTAPPAGMPETTVSQVVTETPDSIPENSAEPWMGAYQDILLDSGSNAPRMITLADATRDGIPELFFADLGTSNRWIIQGFSYSDGRITDIAIPDEWMPPDLELYRSKNGDMVWIAGGTMKNGAAEYNHEWYSVDFSDLSAVKQSFLFGWIERTADGSTLEYFLYGGDGTGRYEDAVNCGLADVLARQEQIFAGYELLETNSSYTPLSDFIIGYDGTAPVLTRENIDSPRLMAYFADWQIVSGSPENRVPYSVPPENSTETWKEAYINVLYEAIPFYSTDLKENIVLSRLVETVTSDKSLTASVDVFTVIDLDNDGTPEVLLSILLNENNNVGYEILHYQDGAVYGYTIWTRAFTEVKTDGTYGFSSGAGDWGYSTITFTDKSYETDEFTFCQSFLTSAGNPGELYYVNNEQTLEEEFLQAVGQQNAKPDATWYEFTEANIAVLLN